MIKALLNFWRTGSTLAANDDIEIYLGGNPSGINILVFTEFINATYYLSFDFPLRKLHASGHVNFAAVSQSYVAGKNETCWQHWHDVFHPDFVVMSRYGQKDGIKILDYFRTRNIPVIYHIDDNLLEIPESLGAEIQQRHGDSQVIQTRQYLLENCDLIYASTQYLGDAMRQHFPTQKIFNGIYAPYLRESLTDIKPIVRSNPVIGYMGSKGHQQDLELVVPAIEQLLEQYQNLEFEVFGTIKLPDALKRFTGRVRSHAVQKSYIDFLTALASLHWDIGLAPLVDTPFNRCKAPTKFIEYTACGIPVAASAISVYTKAFPEQAGIFVKDDWYEQIVSFLEDRQIRNRCLEIAQNHCAQNYSLEILQTQLLNVFKIAKKFGA